MKADGTIVQCSRDENTQLFSLVLGEYGLFGIILDVDLEVVPNRRYRRQQFVVPAEQSLAAFDEVLQKHPDVPLIYARMNVTADQFLGEVILNVFHDEPSADGSLPPLEAP